MKTRLIALFLTYIVFITACGNVTPSPIPLATSPTFVLPSTAPLPTATETATVTPTPWSSPTPETLYGYPTAQAAVLPTCAPNGDCLKLEDNVEMKDFALHELYVGKYVLRNWCNIDPQFTFLSPCAVTISSKDTKQIEIWGYPAKFGKETGADLTGHGKPDIVITNYSGGNCCVETIVYEVGDNLTKIMDIGSYRIGTFTDLNGDETYEYIAPYRNFSSFCTGCTLWTSAVYEYQPSLGYVPATYKFKDVLSADIQRTLDFITQFTKQNPNMPFHFLDIRYYDNPSAEDNEFLKFDKENSDYSRAVNALYQLIAYYLLAGQRTDAQNILNKYFPPNEAAEYMLAIEQDLQGLLAP
jgi:hypothetical protein